MATMDNNATLEPVTTVTLDTTLAVEVPDIPEKVLKEKKAKVLKEKKSKTSKVTCAHPTYMQMVKEAICFLKERTGSSQYAIVKFLEDQYKSSLPRNFKKTLSIQLRNLSRDGKLTKVKNSFKLSGESKKLPKAPKSATTTLPSSRPEVKKTAGRPKLATKKSSSGILGSKSTSTKAAKSTKAKSSNASKAGKESANRVPSKKAVSQKKTIKLIKSASKSPKVAKTRKAIGTARRSAAGLQKKAKK